MVPNHVARFLTAWNCSTSLVLHSCLPLSGDFKSLGQTSAFSVTPLRYLGSLATFPSHYSHLRQLAFQHQSNLSLPGVWLPLEQPQCSSLENSLG